MSQFKKLAKAKKKGNKKNKDKIDRKKSKGEIVKQHKF
jgi:hypothetical protein